MAGDDNRIDRVMPPRSKVPADQVRGGKQAETPAADKSVKQPVQNRLHVKTGTVPIVQSFSKSKSQSDFKPGSQSDFNSSNVSGNQPSSGPAITPVTPSGSSAGAAAVAQAAKDDTLVGTILSDDLQIVRMVGFGGYGRVYQAEQLSVGKRSVAIKVLHAMHKDRKAAVTGFKREVSYLAMLKSACFPRVIRTGLTPDHLPYFAMEFISGKSLDQILKANGPLNINRAAFIMDRVCEGVIEMHRRDIIHRDIKPGNVIIEEGPAKSWRVWMLDLGCAKSAYEPDSSPKRTDIFSFGSPPYLAPETVISGASNEQTDIYALGCLAYEILAGIRAVHLKDTGSDSYFSYLRNPEKPLPTYRLGTIMPEVPESVEQVIHKALARDVAARFTSVMDFRNALMSAAAPYMDKMSSMAIDIDLSSNVSGFARKGGSQSGGRVPGSDGQQKPALWKSILLRLGKG
jgi:serine/threonine-protein kinase